MQTVADILIYAAERSPENCALISGEMHLSYGALLKKAKALGSSLHAMGIGQGARILTLLQNHQEAAILHWAAQIYGITICPINWRTTAIELEYFAKDCSAKAIFFDEKSREAVEAYTPAEGVFVIDTSQGLLERALRFDAETAPPLPHIDENEISVILYTSGTTGRGKGVPRSHRAERAAALAQIGQNALLANDVALGVMPLYHTMGVRILLTTAFLSGCFICQPKFDANETLGLIENHSITSLYLVPTLYHDLVNAQVSKQRDLSSIIRLGFAGASMSDGLLKRVSNTFSGVKLVNHYGSSEIYTYTINQNAALKPGSAGRSALNAQIAITPLDSTDTTARVDVGVEGQVIASLQSAEAFTGYLNRPEADAKALKEGWYFTGDVGYWDEDRELFLTGRVDDMIITGGENVMPVEIESVLSLHAKVSEAVVIGKPDERLGQRILAFVIAQGDTSHKELDEHCRLSGLPGYRCPKEYKFVAEIPKSPVGKILRRFL